MGALASALYPEAMQRLPGGGRAGAGGAPLEHEHSDGANPLAGEYARIVLGGNAIIRERRQERAGNPLTIRLPVETTTSCGSHTTR